MIHEIFINDTSGINIYHYFVRETKVDLQMITSLISALMSFSDEVFFSKVQKIDLENRRLTFLTIDPKTVKKDSSLPPLLGVCVSDLTDHPLALQRFLRKILYKFVEISDNPDFNKSRIKEYPEFEDFLRRYLKFMTHPRNWLFVICALILCGFTFYLTSWIFYQKGIVEWRDLLAFCIGSLLIMSCGMLSGTKVWGAIIPFVINLILAPFLMYIFNESGIVSFMFSAGSLSIISGTFGGFLAERLWLFKSNKYHLNKYVYFIMITIAFIIFLIELFVIFPSVLH